jgi:hypothetical protein
MPVIYITLAKNINPMLTCSAVGIDALYPYFLYIAQEATKNTLAKLVIR